MSDHVEHHIAALYEKIAQLAGIVERTHRAGKVTDVDYSDATKPRIRIAIGKDADGGDVKGPWIPVVSHAGDRTIHAPVSIGQTMLQLSPDGNFENAVAMHYGFSSKTKSPSTDKDTHVDQLGDVTTTLKKDSHVRAVKNAKVTHDANGLKLEVGGTSFTFTSGGLAVQGGSITHDGKHIDSTHVHSGVQPGYANTQPPAN